MGNNMKNSDVNFDICQILGVNKEQPFDEIIKEIEKRMERFRQMVDRNPNEESLMVLKRAEEAYQALLDENRAKYSDDTKYDFAFNERMTANNRMNNILASFESKDKKRNYKLVKERKIKQAKKVKINPFWKGFVAGVLVCVCAFGGVSGINHMKQQNEANNVCVEYVVQDGDTYQKMDECFKEYSFSYKEVTGAVRNSHYIYEGDIIIGRTTKENADKLVAEGSARIISIEEACNLLGENNALIGEFRAFANGNSDMVFFVPAQIAKV